MEAEVGTRAITGVFRREGNNMGYDKALRAAGATVESFEMCGDYQGIWLARISTPAGPRFIRGYYGSCSGCDSFSAEFDYDHHSWDAGPEHLTAYNDAEAVPGCEECERLLTRLRNFGQGYLEDAMSADRMAMDLVAQDYWSSDDGFVAQQLVSYLSPAVNETLAAHARRLAQRRG